MALYLKTALDGEKGQAKLSKILMDAKKKILKNADEKANKIGISELEKKLNNLFYPEDGVYIKNFSDYINKMESGTIEQTLVDVFNNFDFENNNGKKSYKLKEGQQYIQTTTLKNAIDEIKSIIEKIKNFPEYSNIDVLTKALTECELKVNEGNRILEEDLRTKYGNQYFQINTKTKNAIDIINFAAALMSATNHPNRISTTEAGDLFEEALGMVNFVEASGKALINYSIEDLKKSVLGKELIRRGSKDGIHINIKADLLTEKEKEDYKHYQKSVKNMDITYFFDPYSKRQGKMDVLLQLEDINPTPFRVSAKNWRSTGYGDLGETSIEAGISRSSNGNTTIMNAYKLAVLTPLKDDWDIRRDGVPKYVAAQYAHDYAVTALKSDIAMGLSQGIQQRQAGYADTLIVDNGKAIKIYDLYKIVADIDQKIKVSGYDNSVIESVARSAYERISDLKLERTNNYLKLMFLTLNKMKVTIYLNAKS